MPSHIKGKILSMQKVARRIRSYTPTSPSSLRCCIETSGNSTVSPRERNRLINCKLLLNHKGYAPKTRKRLEEHSAMSWSCENSQDYQSPQSAKTTDPVERSSTSKDGLWKDIQPIGTFISRYPNQKGANPRDSNDRFLNDGGTTIDKGCTSWPSLHG